MKEELRTKLKEIVDGERLALDSYFFCGSGSSLPDEELVSSGEAYLQSAAEGAPDASAKERLLSRLEAAASKKTEVLKVRAVRMEGFEDPRTAVLRELLENKEDW